MQAAAILALIQGALIAAPDVIAAAIKARNLIQNLFDLGVVTADEQALLWERTQETCYALIRGERPPAWQVEPDPK